MDQEVIRNIRNRIAHGKLEEALKYSLNVTDENSEHRDSFISLTKRYERLIENQAKNIIDQNTFESETNKIMSSTLDILNDMEFKVKDKELVFFEALEDRDYEKYILDHISRGDLNEAFRYLDKWLDKKRLSKSEFKDRFLLLLSRYNSNKDAEVKGLLTNETIREENLRTASNLIKLIKELNEVPEREKQEKAKQEHIEISAASFVEESITALSKREQKLKFQAIFWYLVGFIALLSGIGVSLFLVIENEDQFQSTIGIVYLILKSIIIIGLLVAASRYAFNLGKTYMNEALKNADRIHAISFGKFYLKVFGANVKSEDLKDVFKDWNTIQESPFMKLDSSEFDPQLLQAFLKFTELIKSGKK